MSAGARPGLLPGVLEYAVPEPFDLETPGYVDTTRTDALRAVLESWARANRLAWDNMPVRPISVDPAEGRIRYWVMVNAPIDLPDDGRVIAMQPAGRNTPALARIGVPLRIAPAGLLVGDDTCGHTAEWQDLLLTCGREVDDQGRHPGAHQDAGDSNHTWTNRLPGVLNYRAGAPWVADLADGEQHDLVLFALEERVTATQGSPARWRTRDTEGLAGRRRILERHRPGTRGLCDARCATWPCPTYQDAAAGLVAGLVIR